MQSDAEQSAMPQQRGLLVWDLPLRIFHWALALSILGAWVTHKIGASAFVWHRYCGYTVLVLIVFRLIWGVAGPRYARFSSFVHGPVGAWRQLRGFFGRDAGPHPAGHTALGGWMVLLFLGLLLAQALCGLFANDDFTSTGPLYGYVSDTTSDALSSWHRRLSDILWIAIGVHLAAVTFYWLVKRQNLVWAMITGRKKHLSGEKSEGIDGSRTILAIIILAVCAAALYWVIATAPEPPMLSFD